MISSLHKLALIAIALFLTGGCGLSTWIHNGFEVGPDYRCPPSAAVEEIWIDSDDARVVAGPAEFWDWWSVFRDSALNELVEEAFRQNLTLREAGMRVLEARFQRAIAVGNLLPQAQQIEGGYSRNQLGTVSQPFVLPAPGFERSFDRWSLAGNLSWELDIWGRFRRAVEAADANLDASVNQYDAILVSLIAEVASAYVEIRTFEQRLAYAQHNVRIQEKSLELTQTRFDEGKTDAISVHLSKSNLEATRASIPSLEIGLRQANNRLCTLLGVPPVDLAKVLPLESGIPNAPPEVAVGIPADLLRRRPDVRAAEREVAAQCARIGIALSNLYPRIAVTGKISLDAEKLGDLFTSDAQGGSIGPSFEWNVLNYGRIINNARLQDARMAELIAKYQNTVLDANREVEDALVSFLRNQERVKSLEKTVKETQQALALALIQFEEGEADFTGVYVLQGALVGQQDRFAASQGDVATSLIGVYKALGGGWQIRCPGYRSRSIAGETPEAAPEPERIPKPAPEPVKADEQDVVDERPLRIAL